ncbi:unnamed protein product [Mesocestoides corti]|uniref:Death domain-containing protein n=1 Tax=Mesocestoides corti TaxID=53468 RepID=A0A0R3UAH1_MESCO|nr:unnamed protein product [Mesocestoides corti]
MELAQKLLHNQPLESYTASVSFAYYNNSLALETDKHAFSVELNSLRSIGEDGVLSHRSSRQSALTASSAQNNLCVSASPAHPPGTPLHAKLPKSLGLKEIQALLGSLHPEVDWAEVFQVEVFNKAPVEANHQEVLSVWLEDAFKTGKLHAAKVMAALQERVRNPHIRKLPAGIAAHLPPPNETPPTPPSTLVPDLDSNVLSDTDDWSSTTSFETDEKRSQADEVISVHVELPADEKPTTEEGEDNAFTLLTNGLADEKKRESQKSQVLNVVSISGRMLKLIIDRPEFQSALAQETTVQKALSTSQLK